MTKLAHGPDDPHPLSTLKTELVWEGKYDEYGNRREIDAAGLAVPLQRIETVDEPRARSTPGLWDAERAHPDDFRNMLVWGDNKLVMASLLKDFRGQVDLIYIDPPFDVGADFTMTVDIGDGTDEAPKDQSALEMVAYRDMWGRGRDSYLHMMYESLVLLRELLKDTGSIFVHVDVHMGPYLKILMDELFGDGGFQNEIAWYYYNKLHGARKKCIPKAFDQILYYVKNREAQYTYHTLTEPRDKPVTKLKYRFIDGKITNVKDAEGKTVTYESTERQLDNVWRVRCLQPANKEEWVNFDTQKPVDLIERILAIASNEGDLVMDAFCGSGQRSLPPSEITADGLAATSAAFRSTSRESAFSKFNASTMPEASPTEPSTSSTLAVTNGSGGRRSRSRVPTRNIGGLSSNSSRQRS